MLFKMIEVEMGIAESVDKLPRLKVAYLGDHHRQQGIRGDVEGDAQKDVGAALVQLAR